MRIKDAIAIRIQKYPTLYLYPDYVSCALRILDHMFGVLGGGDSWAYTKKPEKAGYLVFQEKIIKRGDNYIRCYDAPYGKEKCSFDVIKAIKEDIVWVSCAIPGIRDELYKYFSIEEFKEVEAEYRAKEFTGCLTGEMIENGEIDKYIDMVHIRKVIESNLKHIKFWQCDHVKYCGWRPYPNYRKKHFVLWEEEAKYIQDDWAMAALWWLNECVSFYEEERWRQFNSRDDDRLADNKKIILDFYHETIEHVVGLMSSKIRT